MRPIRLVLHAAVLAAAFSVSMPAQLIKDVRALTAKGELQQGERLIQEYRKTNGVTPESIEAWSWLGRGALALKQYDQAMQYAESTRAQVDQQLKTRPLDAERHLPLALGACIEVQSQAMAAQGRRSEAVLLLKEEIARWRKTSIVTRLNKNLNLLTLVGTPAPRLEPTAQLGPPAPKLGQTGKPALLFFWAHWCADCKAQVPALAALKERYPELSILAPTRYYGYAEAGQDASPEEERKHMQAVLEKYYRRLKDMPVLIGNETFEAYGASTTPTFVLVDGQGIVRMYHPGRLTADELASELNKIERVNSSGGGR